MRSRLGGRRVIWVLAVLALVASGGVLAVRAQRSTGPRAAQAARDAGHQRKAVAKVGGHEGGEAGRERDKSPASEAVAMRAYPRSYVDDRRALRERRAFDRLPRSAPRSAFRSGRAFRAALTAAPDHWTNFGPRTPNVSAEASQFYDPIAQKGPATQESGRVTAMAIDPNCDFGDCRMWIAAAGGGIWRTDDALASRVQWIAPPDDLPTNAFGSLIYDAANQTLYAGSGEPNGSGDSEAGLGLFKSTDFGASWSLVPGSQDVAINRSIGSIAVDPRDPNTLYIGTAVARHGSSSANGGRRTPPGAPALGVYKSTDGGKTFARLDDLAGKTPANPSPPETGVDWFQGGINRIEIDPNNADAVYAAVIGYGLWRSTDAGAHWRQVFHTMNQNDFSDPNDPLGDFFGDRTEFDLVKLGSLTRIYLGDASDDWAVDGDDATPAPRVWRVNNAAGIVGTTDGTYSNAAWTELSNSANGTNGYLAYGYCQNGQCGYDSYVVSPPGSPNSVWLGGSMHYEELPAYPDEPPRSNGRATVRSTNAGAAKNAVTWQDMTADLGSDDRWDVTSGQHPDLHAVVFADHGNIAFVGSDGGVTRIDVTSTEDHSASCDQRSLAPADLTDCKKLLSATPSAVTPLNDGLATLQFQSLSANPQDPEHDVLGGTQDNGTFSFSGTTAWFESVGGDGGQSAFDAANPTIRYHNYYNATPEVNFHGNDPQTWLNIYDVLANSGEAQSFYSPFIADPVTGGRAFTGLQHVWRTDDNGGSEAALDDRCNALNYLDTSRPPCGDWLPLGQDLTSDSFGDRAGQYIVATERAPSDEGTLWAGTRIGRLFVSSNSDADAAAVQFFRIDNATTPERFVSGIAIDPHNPNHAWVSYSGYGAYTPSTPGHVYEVTYDPGAHTATWTDRSNNIGDQPVTDIAVNGDTGDVYASTDFGVLRLPAGSSSWADAAPGLPHVAVYGLTLAQGGHVLYAATHGRSSYALELPVPAPPPPPIPGQPPTPPPSATPDTVKPTLSLKHIKRRRHSHRVTIKGRAADAGGIRRVTVYFADGHKRTVHLNADGTFRTRHRYHKARRYRITVVAVDQAGNKTTKHQRTRVLKH